MDRWERTVAELREVVADLDARCVEGRDALRRVHQAAEVERLAAAAKALYAQRCVETGVWQSDADARVSALTPAEWLADVSGSGIGPARDALAVAEALPERGNTDAALRSGQVSLSVAREVTAAAEVGGELAEQRVLGTAQREGLRAARDETRRVLAHAADAAERAAKIHRDRSRRRWITRDGVWNLHLAGPVALGAEIEACLAPFDDAAWDARRRSRRRTRKGDERDTPDAIAFDGFLGALRCRPRRIRCRGGQAAGSGEDPRPRGRPRRRRAPRARQRRSGRHPSRRSGRALRDPRRRPGGRRARPWTAGRRDPHGAGRGRPRREDVRPPRPQDGGGIAPAPRRPRPGLHDHRLRAGPTPRARPHPRRRRGRRLHRREHRRPLQAPSHPQDQGLAPPRGRARHPPPRSPRRGSPEARSPQGRRRSAAA